MKSRALKPVKPPLLQEFEEASLTLYHSMKNRKVGNEKIELTFSLGDFRIWLMDQLGGRADNLIRCVYCTRWLVVAKLKPRGNVFPASVDHIYPLAKPWMGGTGIDNLCLSCLDCNIAKGRVSGPGWMLLVGFLLDLDPRDRTDILNRLAHGNAGQVEAWKKHKARRESRQVKLL